MRMVMNYTVSICPCVRLFPASLFMHAKEKVSKVSAKLTEVGKDWASLPHYTNPHPLPSKIFHLVLPCSSLQILSMCSTIECKYDKMEVFEQSINILVHLHSVRALFGRYPLQLDNKVWYLYSCSGSCLPRAWIEGNCPNIILNVNGVNTRFPLLGPHLKQNKIEKKHQLHICMWSQSTENAWQFQLALEIYTAWINISVLELYDLIQ